MVWQLILCLRELAHVFLDPVLRKVWETLSLLILVTSIQYYEGGLEVIYGNSSG